MYAVATERLGDHIAAWRTVVRQTSNFQIDMERGQPHDSQGSRARMFANFERVRAELEEQGVRVERGRWTYDAPEHLVSR